MAGKHRRVAEVPFDEVRDAATQLGYPVDSVVLEHPDEREPYRIPSAGDGMAIESARVLPDPVGTRRSRLETRRTQSRRNRLAALVAVSALVLGGVAWAVLRGGADPVSSAPAAPQGRSQTTLLLQVVNSSHEAIVSVLLAHDSADGGNGFAALLPSQLEVNVAGIGNASLAQTATYSSSNAPALAVSDALGVIVDGTWTLTTESLAALVDAAGGVQVTVDRDVLRASTGGGGATILLNAGAQKLDGILAATYATYLADGEPEAKRLARFADVFREVVAGLPGAAQQIATSVGRLGGSTESMPLARIGSVLEGLRGDLTAGSLMVQNVPTRSLDGGTENTAQVVDPTALDALVRSAFAGSLPAKRASGDVRVLVQNGVGTPGLGEFARKRLLQGAMTYVNGGNAPSFSYATSVILISDVALAARSQGKAVARALGLPESDVQVAAQGQSLADVIVVLGADFKP